MPIRFIMIRKQFIPFIILRFQGNFTSHAVRALGYRFDDININYMQLGIQYATKVTTVSETYAKEILNGFLWGKFKSYFMYASS